MVREEFLECRDCGDEFNALSPFHAERGYRNQCGDCAEDVETVKALVNVNEEGDIEGMKIVSSSVYNKVQKAVFGKSSDSDKDED